MVHIHIHIQMCIHIMEGVENERNYQSRERSNTGTDGII